MSVGLQVVLETIHAGSTIVRKAEGIVYYLGREGSVQRLRRLSLNCFGKSQHYVECYGELQ